MYEGTEEKRLFYAKKKVGCKKIIFCVKQSYGTNWEDKYTGRLKWFIRVSSKYYNFIYIVLAWQHLLVLTIHRPFSPMHVNITPSRHYEHFQMWMIVWWRVSHLRWRCRDKCQIIILYLVCIDAHYRFRLWKGNQWIVGVTNSKLDIISKWTQLAVHNRAH